MKKIEKILKEIITTDFLNFGGFSLKDKVLRFVSKFL